MTITFCTPEDGVKAQKEWKKHATPCFLKKTYNPLNYSVCVRHNVDPVYAQLFVIKRCMHPDCHKKLIRKTLKSYPDDEKKRILKYFNNHFDWEF